jgi:hypothetical protein
VTSVVRSPRLAAAACCVLVLAAGLGVRAFTGGWFAKYAGVALYATLAFGLVLLIAPRRSPVRAGAVAVAWCWAVEFAQLTPGPAALSERSGLARLVLGSTFNWPDLLAYVIGIAVPLAGLVAISRGRRDRGASPPA